MKVRIAADEWYPFFSLSDNAGEDEVEVDEAKVADWKYVLAEVDRVQSEMAYALNHRQTPQTKGDPARGETGN